MWEGILIGVGGTVGAALLIGAAAVFARLLHTPKRLDRIERLIPALLRAVQALLIAHKTGGANGQIDESIDELRTLTTDGSVSQRARA